jgi:chromate reductase, NAD(P)H dehydrogenase (quinone)
MAPKILAFAGSTRQDSFNKKLIRIAVKGAEAAGAEVTLIDLRDYPMPIYDGDFEDKYGIPENGRKFMDILIAHQGIMIASPEYNSSLSGVLKNSIDWASRPVKGMIPLAAFDKKVACIMSASEGSLGGIRGLIPLRSILGNIKVLVLPDQYALNHADVAFDENGNIKDEKKQSAVLKLGKTLTHTLMKLNS